MSLDGSLKRKRLVLVLGVLIAGNITAAELAPPPYSATDRMNVNMASGHVQISQTDLSIGGERGLTHTISTHSSEFANDSTGIYGYVDRFRGRAYGTFFKPSSNSLTWIPIVRVFGNGQIEDFSYVNNGGSYTYTSLHDPRNTLKFVSGTGLVYTQSDGTEVIYGSNTTSFQPVIHRPNMTQIKHPNGLNITVNYDPGIGSPVITSVTSNTGFQLKYLFEDDNRPLDPAKASSPLTQVLRSRSVQESSLSWSRHLPKHIVAINNAVETCDVEATTCALAGEWPKVTYDWPAGMPLAMYVGTNTFKVTDAGGRVTEYGHTGIDHAEPTSNGGWYKNIRPNQFSSPRITTIKPPNDSATTYTYGNHTTSGMKGQFNSWQSVDTAVLETATHAGETMRYSIGELQVLTGGVSGQTLNASVGYQPISYVTYVNPVGGLREIDAWDQKIKFTVTLDNRVASVEQKFGGNYITFEYDNRSNVTQRTEQEAPWPNNGVITAKASYPATCNATNRKYCNQATWIEDANGNRTHYTYHAASGQVATITRPADERGIRAQTRYQYAQYSGTHDGPDSSAIWLLKTEEFCRNSAASGNACAGNDETVITYEYDAKNLFLIGKAVAADGTTLRTCYRYDRYGNQIGETQPKANLSSCAYNE